MVCDSKILVTALYICDNIIMGQYQFIFFTDLIGLLFLFVGLVHI